MRNSVKGALLSGLVYPGFGQIAQKNYIRGTLLILIVSWGLFQIVTKVLKQITEMFESFKGTNISISTDDIFRVILELLPDVGGPSYSTLMVIIAGCWIVGVVDAWHVGRKIDLRQRSQEMGPDLTDLVELE